MDWSYWQKVVIVCLAIIVVVLGYKRLLRWVGGNARFDNKFAFLFPLEWKGPGILLVRFELPEADVVTLTIFDEQDKAVDVILDRVSLEQGEHHYEADMTTLSSQTYTCVLQSGNQKVERIFSKAPLSA